MAEKMAVIGAGPAGLSCAFQLARRGYPVTVFEALARPGGMLRYGIPAFRLPRAVLDAEIAAIVELGVEIECNHPVDGSGLATALRESREEMGIEPGDLEILGQFDDFVSIAGFLVETYVGILRAADGVTAFEVRKAKIELFSAESDLVSKAAAWRIAQVELKESQGLLAKECGYCLPACDGGPCR